MILTAPVSPSGRLSDRTARLRCLTGAAERLAARIERTLDHALSTWSLPPADRG